MGTKIVSWFTSKHNIWYDGLFRNKFNNGVIINFIFHLIKHNCMS